MEIRWNFLKNIELKKKRNITFEQLLDSKFLGIENHPREKHQKLMLFEHERYVWVVPYVKAKGYYFLKTAFRSRKHTKKYLGGDR